MEAMEGNSNVLFVVIDGFIIIVLVFIVGSVSC